MLLSPQEKSKVVASCMSDIIPRINGDTGARYPNEWFTSQFTFLNDTRVAEHLGDAFFQARFSYKLMCNLSLPLSKNKGIVKFQIIQYASLCEALLNFTIEHYFKDEFGQIFPNIEYKQASNALSNMTTILYDNKPLGLYFSKVKPGIVHEVTNPPKAKFAYQKGILTEGTMNQYRALYDLRNNTHILKAASADYYPKIRESKDAFTLFLTFKNEIQNYFLLHP